MYNAKIFLKDVDKFCKKNNVSESRFGRDALGDPTFVSTVRKGRSPTLDLVERVYKYMKKAGGDAFDILG